MPAGGFCTFPFPVPGTLRRLATPQAAFGPEKTPCQQSVTPVNNTKQETPRWSVAALGSGWHLARLAAAFLQQGARPWGWWAPAEESDPSAGQLQKQFPVLPHWETLLEPEAVQVVLVGKDPRAELQEPLRHLVQQPLQVILCHPMCLEWMFYYELEMHAQEGLGPPLAWSPVIWHPGLEVLLLRLERWEEPLERVVMQWESPQQGRESTPWELARCAGLLRVLAEPPNQVAATALPGAEDPWQHLELQLSSPHGPLVRWSARVAQQSCFQMELLSRKHRLVLQAEHPECSWTLEEEGGEPLRLQVVPEDAARRFARWWAKEQGVAPEPPRQQVEPSLQEPPRQKPPAGPAAEVLRVRPLELPHADFDAAARELELVGAVEESLRRGRRIQLHEMQYSEQQVFRGLMSALGCGLLVLSLIVFVVGELVAGRMGWGWGRWWPVVLLVLLGGFLLVQLLQFGPARSEQRK